MPMTSLRSSTRPWLLASGLVYALTLGVFRLNQQACEPTPVSADSESRKEGVRRNLRWVGIEPGLFTMGCDPGDTGCALSESPRHRVKLTRAFRMLATEVTVEQYTAARLLLPRQPMWNNEPTQPVVNVSWYEARKFCGRIGGRLPTEAEWEYAARGGIGQARSAGGPASPVVVGKIGRNTCCGGCTAGDVPWKKTVPVGAFGRNLIGLYDMDGNVSEWIADWFAPVYPDRPQEDPEGPQSGNWRIVRGGNWFFPPSYSRPSRRYRALPDARLDYVGFRCVSE